MGNVQSETPQTASSTQSEGKSDVQHIEKTNSPNTINKIKYEAESRTCDNAETCVSKEVGHLNREPSLGQNKEEATDMGGKFSKNMSWKVTKRWSSSIGKVSSVMTTATSIQGTANSPRETGLKTTPPNAQANMTAQEYLGNPLSEGESVDPPTTSTESNKQNTNHILLKTSLKVSTQDNLKTKKAVPNENQRGQLNLTPKCEASPLSKPQDPLGVRLPRVAQASNIIKNDTPLQRSTPGSKTNYQNVQKQSGQGHSINGQGANSQKLHSLATCSSQNVYSEASHDHSIHSQAAYSQNVRSQVASSENVQIHTVHTQSVNIQAVQSQSWNSHPAHIENLQSYVTNSQRVPGHTAHSEITQNHMAGFEKPHNHVTYSQSLITHVDGRQNGQCNSVSNEQIHHPVGKNQHFHNHESHTMGKEIQGDKQKGSLKKKKSQEPLLLTKKQTHGLATDALFRVQGASLSYPRPATPFPKSFVPKDAEDLSYIGAQAKTSLLREGHGSEEVNYNQGKNCMEPAGGHGDGALEGGDSKLSGDSCQSPTVTELQCMQTPKHLAQHETNESLKNYASVLATTSPMVEGRKPFLQQDVSIQQNTEDMPTQGLSSTEAAQQRGNIQCSSGVSYADALKQKSQQKSAQMIAEQPTALNTTSGNKISAPAKLDDNIPATGMALSSPCKDHSCVTQMKEILYEQLKNKLNQDKDIENSPSKYPKQQLHQSQPAKHETSTPRQRKPQQKSQHLLHEASTLRETKQYPAQNVLHETTSAAQTKQAQLQVSESSTPPQTKPQQVQRHLPETRNSMQAKSQQKAHPGLREVNVQSQAKMQPKALHSSQDVNMAKHGPQQQMQHLFNEGGTLTPAKLHQDQRQIHRASSVMQSKPQQKTQNPLHPVMPQSQVNMQQKAQQQPPDENVVKQRAQQHVQPLMHETSTLTQLKMQQKIQPLLHEISPLSPEEMQQTQRQQHQVGCTAQGKQHVQEAQHQMNEISIKTQAKQQEVKGQRPETRTLTQVKQQQKAHPLLHDVSTQNQAQVLQKAQHLQKEPSSKQASQQQDQLPKKRARTEDKPQQNTQPLQQVNTEMQPQVHQMAQHLPQEATTLKQPTQQQHQHQQLLQEADSPSHPKVEPQVQEPQQAQGPSLPAQVKPVKSQKQKAKLLLHDVNTLKQARQGKMLQEAVTLSQSNQQVQQSRLPRTSEGCVLSPTAKTSESQAPLIPISQPERQDHQNNKTPKIIQAAETSIQQASFNFTGAKPTFDWSGSQNLLNNHFQFSSITKAEEKKNMPEALVHSEAISPYQNVSVVSESQAGQPTSKSQENLPAQDKEGLHDLQRLLQQTLQTPGLTEQDLKTKQSLLLPNQGHAKILPNTTSADRDPQTLSLAVTPCYGAPSKQRTLTIPHPVDLKMNVTIKDNIPQNIMQVQEHPQTSPGKKESSSPAKRILPSSFPGKELPGVPIPAEVLNTGPKLPLVDSVVQIPDHSNVQDDLTSAASQTKMKVKGQSTARATSKPPFRSQSQHKRTANSAHLLPQENAKVPSQTDNKQQKKRKEKKEGELIQASQETKAEGIQGKAPSTTSTTSTSQAEADQEAKGTSEKIRPSGLWPPFRVDSSCPNRCRSFNQTERRLPENVDKW
ncbi:hypothetical protein NDU88_004936 [Pleurodeles waltl]|uniref:Methylcytosine dioxygenase TET n=1 Tax=Pleurodeles waltl TaxID=8319 RepID=A0AAV7MW10_PLEWA|nr:hypothetical protein NDU88_004936 [Pleurodeles waltl]